MKWGEDGIYYESGKPKDLSWTCYGLLIYLLSQNNMPFGEALLALRLNKRGDEGIRETAEKLYEYIVKKGENHDEK